MDKETYKVMRTYLKENIIKCNKGEVILFRRNYSPNNPDLSMDEIIDNISDDIIHIPMVQLGLLLERTEQVKERRDSLLKSIEEDKEDKDKK